jgi:hypothetical protein
MWKILYTVVGLWYWLLEKVAAGELDRCFFCRSDKHLSVNELWTSHPLKAVKRKVVMNILLSILYFLCLSVLAHLTRGHPDWKLQDPGNCSGFLR